MRLPRPSIAWATCSSSKDSNAQNAVRRVSMPSSTTRPGMRATQVPDRDPRLQDRGPLAAARDVEPDAESPAPPGDEVEVEPDHVPPQNEIGIVGGEPREQPREEGAFVGQRLHRRVLAVNRMVAHHQHPLVVRRVQRDRVERAVEPRGLDVQRDPPQRPAVVVAPDRGVAHLQVAGSAHRLAPRRESRGHEPLHQEAVAGLQVGLAGRDAPTAKQVPRRHQIALAPEIQRVDRHALQGGEVQRPTPAPQAPERIVPGHRFPLHEAHRLFPVEYDAQRPVLRRSPQRELQSIGGVPPVAGQEERAQGLQSRSPVDRGTPCTAIAGAPTTMKRTPAPCRVISGSRKSSFIGRRRRPGE